LYCINKILFTFGKCSDYFEMVICPLHLAVELHICNLPKFYTSRHFKKKYKRRKHVENLAVFVELKRKKCVAYPQEDFLFTILYGSQKKILNTSKVKKTKIHMVSIRQSLQAEPKNIKKLSKHQINQSK
jgi:hypothetical protein